MGFNENTFIVAGTAIAIFGVGLYIWDSRKESFKSAAASGYNAIAQPTTGGSKTRRKKNKNSKTRKH